MREQPLAEVTSRCRCVTGIVLPPSVRFDAVQVSVSPAGLLVLAFRPNVVEALVSPATPVGGVLTPL
jgi:hypothetical protein